MSYPMRRNALGVGLALLVVIAVPVQAAVQCPSISAGHALRSSGGGTLFEGPIQDNAALAPEKTQQGPEGWVNNWRFRSPPDVTLVCRYADVSTPVSLKLTPDIRSCRQDARSFVCH